MIVQPFLGIANSAVPGNLALALFPPHLIQEK